MVSQFSSQVSMVFQFLSRVSMVPQFSSQVSMAGLVCCCRASRPVLAWREIIEGAGFVDAMVRMHVTACDLCLARS